MAVCKTALRAIALFLALAVSANPAYADPALDLRVPEDDAPAAPAFFSELPAGSTTADPSQPGADLPSACMRSAHLPWGPISTCKEAVLTVGLTGAAAFAFTAWWRQGFNGNFNVAKEGWFGQTTYAGGVDKLGHAFSFYAATRLSNQALQWAQIPADQSLPLAVTVNLAAGLAIEVFDGLSRGGNYGFGWQDLAMDVVGVGLGALTETHPQIDKYFAFRWLYSSQGLSQGGEWYDHSRYLLAFRLSGFESIKPDNPLRYVEVLAGYGATGYRTDVQYGQPGVADERQRSLYFGVGLNLTEIFDRAFFAGERRGGRLNWFTNEFLKYVQVPGTAALYQKKLPTGND